jgi:hypothetical protein
VLGLTSWAAVLAEVLHATEVAGDNSASEDLRQLKGLSDRMEQAGFMPLRGDELTSVLPRRIADYCGLADDVTSTLIAEDLVNTKGLKATGARPSYTRYVSMKRHGAAIVYHAGWWSTIYPTPLWVQLVGPGFKGSPAIRSAFAAWVGSQPPKAYVDTSGSVLVPLRLPTGCERHVVVSSLLRQVREVYALLPTAAEESNGVASLGGDV